jgi:hypothetical protein
VKRGAVAMAGEVWGVADREDGEAAWNSMMKYLTNQEGCTVTLLGRKTECDLEIAPNFCVKDKKKKRSAP